MKNKQSDNANMLPETLSGSPKLTAQIKQGYRLTKLGEKMARLPIDPKISRMLLAAQTHDCVQEMLVIVSALSIQDPRERPLEAREAAAKVHERFNDKQSDFLAYLNIWDSFQREREKGLSNKQLVQWCRQYFLSHLRMREWRELHKQLADIAVEMGLTTREQAFRRPPETAQLRPSENTGDQDLSAKLKQKQLDKKQHRAQIRAGKEADYEQIHRALLTGLIANVGLKSPEGNDYTGARGSRFHLFPASALFKSKPKWVVAAELTETSRLYARDVAAIQPEWIEQEAPHLVRYHYFEPHWEQKRGEVVASERVTLYGLTVLPRRPVAYGRVAPEEAREIFIRSALVAQEADLKNEFFAHNKKLIREIAELEHKSRRQDVLVDDEALFDFYNQRLPETVWKDAQGGVWGSEDGADRPSENTANGFSDGLKAEMSPENAEIRLSGSLAEAQRLPENGSANGFAEGSSGIHTQQNPMPSENAANSLSDGLSKEQRLTENDSANDFSGSQPKIKIADSPHLRAKLTVLVQTAGQTDLAAWSAACVRHIRHLPSEAIDTAVLEAGLAAIGQWQQQQAAVAQVRQAASRIHAAARQCHSETAQALLRAAGHAVAVGHMAEHALVCSDYAVKTVQSAAVKENIAQAVEAERLWQIAELERIVQSSPNRVHLLSDGLQKEQRLPENGSANRFSGSLKSEQTLPETQALASAGHISGSHKHIHRPSEKTHRKPLPLADLRTFQAWLKTAERTNPRLLYLSRDDLMQHAAAHITEEQFPKFWRNQDGKFKLAYRFEPHHPLDGVTLSLPLTVLNRLNAAELEWLVPGMIREKIQLLIKALPKQIRRICVPAPEFTTRFLADNPDRAAPIIPQLAHFIAKTAGDMRLLEQIDLDEWRAFRLPEHCYFNLRVIDDGGQELAMGRDLAALQQELGQAAAVTFRDITQEFERDNLTAWDIGTLPDTIKFARGKQQLTGYLGLQKEKNGHIALRLFDTPEAAAQAHRNGVIDLMKLQLKEQVKDLNKGIQGFTQAAMLLKHIPADTLREDLAQAVCDRAFIGEDEPPRSEKAFKEQIKRARSRLPAVKEALSRHLQDTAAAYAELNGKLGKHPLTHLLRERLQTLLSAGFATQTPWQQWPRLPVYLKAMTLRMEKYGSNPARDQAREADIRELEQMWQEKIDSLNKQNQPVSDGLKAFRWQLEELRVSLFAQELKTPYPVSVKRLGKEWEKIGKI